MRWILAALALVALIVTLPSCSKPPLYASDAEFADFVKKKYAAEHPDSPLTNVVVTPLSTEGDVQQRKFTADAGSGVKVKGSMSYDKKADKSSYTIEYEYPN